MVKLQVYESKARETSFLNVRSGVLVLGEVSGSSVSSVNSNSDESCNKAKNTWYASHAAFLSEINHEELMEEAYYLHYNPAAFHSALFTVIV